MVRLTVEIDDATFESLQREAQASGLSVEQVLAGRAGMEAGGASSTARGSASAKPGRSPMEEFFRIVDEMEVDFRGWKWNREDVYADRMAKLERRHEPNAESEGR